MTTKVKKKEVRKGYKLLSKVAKARYDNSFVTDMGRENRIKDSQILDVELRVLQEQEVVNGDSVKLVGKYACLGKCFEDAAVASVALEEPRTARFLFSEARRGYKMALEVMNGSSLPVKGLLKRVKACYDGERACAYEFSGKGYFR
jgi:hypothetical protein